MAAGGETGGLGRDLTDRHYVLTGLGIVALASLVLGWMGQPAICKCGTVTLWYGLTQSAENSQHLSDWYSPSHFIHGILFYGALAWILPALAVRKRALIAIALEAAWEIFENTPLIIERYRDTASLDYYGDSVLNSMSDIGFMAFGFYAAYKLPVRISVALIVALELIVGAIIRDNLTLNIVMLIHPFEAIKQWQLGG
jgi:hypothetical protein